MKTCFKYLILFGFALFFGCTPKLTLQSYFVAHQEANGFMSVDIPISFLNPDEIELTADQKEAIDSIDKLNMLGYSVKDGTEEEFQSEMDTIKTILKAEHYNDLMRAGNTSDGKLYIKYIGEDTEIDELIVFGYSPENGFAIIRVLGTNMELSKIMKLDSIIDQFDTENANVENFMEYLL
jgi:hypothetical protein